MQMIFDEDSANVVAAEVRHQSKEERLLKNRILAMTPGIRKTDMWQRNFPVYNFTGEILDSPVY